MASIFKRAQSQRLYSTLLAIVGVALVSIGTYVFTRREIRADRTRIIEGATAEVSQHLTNALGKSLDDFDHVAEIASSFKGERHYDAFLDLVITRYFDTDTKYPFILVVDRHTHAIIASNDEEALHKEGVHTLDNLFQGASSVWTANLPRDQRILLERETLPKVSKLWAQISKGSTSSSDRLVSSYFMVVSSPVPNGSGSASDEAVIGIISWNVFQSAIDDAQHLLRVSGFESGYASLYAADANTVLAHKTHEYIGKKAKEDFKLPIITAAAQRATTSQQSVVAYPFNGKPKFASIIQVSLPALGPTFRWYVGAGLNDEDAFNVMHKLFWVFILTPTTAILVVLSINHLIYRNVTLSIKRFAELAQEVAEGKDSLDAEPQTVDEISDALHNVLLLLKAKTHFKAIENPYIAGNPIRTQEMFFGRQEDLKWIERQLLGNSNSMIGLFGQRRIGKTSLLHHIHKRDFGFKLRSVFIDTQEMLPEIADDASFYKFVGRKLQEEIGPTTGDHNPASAIDLNRLLGRVREIIRPKKLVFLIDELENLQYKFENGNLSQDIPLFLASLLEGFEPVAFVVSGSDQVELESADWRVLNPKLIIRRIGMLAPKDAKLLVTNPLRQLGISIDESVRKNLLRMSGCHPYYTQLLCRILVDELNQRQQYVIKPDYLEQTLAVVLDSPPPPLTYVWNSFESSMLSVACAAYAFALPDENDYLAPEDVLRRLPKEPARQIHDGVAFRTAVEQLFKQDWLEVNQRGGYRFRVDLFRLWTKRYHSVWQVSEELEKKAIV
jgi:hypothetical protein